MDSAYLILVPTLTFVVLNRKVRAAHEAHDKADPSYSRTLAERRKWRARRDRLELEAERIFWGMSRGTVTQVSRVIFDACPCRSCTVDRRTRGA